MSFLSSNQVKPFDHCKYHPPTKVPEKNGSNTHTHIERNWWAFGRNSKSLSLPIFELEAKKWRTSKKRHIFDIWKITTAKILMLESLFLLQWMVNYPKSISLFSKVKIRPRFLNQDITIFMRSLATFFN